MASSTTTFGNTERKSIRLEKSELTRLKKFRAAYNTGVECAAAIDIDRNVLDRVLLTGSGSPTSIGKIRSAIAKDVEISN